MKYTTLSVRIWVDQLEIIRKAAKVKDVTIPEYVRSRLLPLAAKDAGIALPQFPPFVRGRPVQQEPGDITSQIASKLGIKKEDLKKALELAMLNGLGELSEK